MSKNDHYVVKQGSNWVVKRVSAAALESMHRMQGQAEQTAKNTVCGLGGGEIHIQGRDGKWRDSDTVAPGTIPTRYGTRITEETAA
jgi:hypothetical protein